MTEKPEFDAAARRRARWKKAQQARRARQAKKGKVLLRIWVTPDDVAWVKQALKDRRTNDDVLARRRERLKQLTRKAKCADASSRERNDS